MDTKQEEEIRQAWRSIDFVGSFSGLTTFREALRHEKGIKISKDRLFQIMKSDPDFIHETRKVRRVKERRHYNIYGYGKMFQRPGSIPPPLQLKAKNILGLSGSYVRSLSNCGVISFNINK